jgi:hypothetical protein
MKINILNSITHQVKCFLHPITILIKIIFNGYFYQLKIINNKNGSPTARIYKAYKHGTWNIN